MSSAVAIHFSYINNYTTDTRFDLYLSTNVAPFWENWSSMVPKFPPLRLQLSKAVIYTEAV